MSSFIVILLYYSGLVKNYDTIIASLFIVIARHRPGVSFSDNIL